jgi:hypothetical protein
LRVVKRFLIFNFYGLPLRSPPRAHFVMTSHLSPNKWSCSHSSEWPANLNDIQIFNIMYEFPSKKGLSWNKTLTKHFPFQRLKPVMIVTWKSAAIRVFTWCFGLVVCQQLEVSIINTVSTPTSRRYLSSHSWSSKSWLEYEDVFNASFVKLNILLR